MKKLSSIFALFCFLMLFFILGSSEAKAQSGAWTQVPTFSEVWSGWGSGLKTVLTWQVYYYTPSPYVAHNKIYITFYHSYHNEVTGEDTQETSSTAFTYSESHPGTQWSVNGTSEYDSDIVLDPLCPTSWMANHNNIDIVYHWKIDCFAQFDDGSGVLSGSETIRTTGSVAHRVTNY